MNPHEIPKQAEFGLMVSFLASSGFTGQELAQAIGSSPNGRTRAQIAGQLRTWLKERLIPTT